jgi:hypothetical protein
MDWPSHLDSFLSNCENRFNCGFEAKDDAQCEVLQEFGTDGLNLEVQSVDLAESKDWDDWFEKCAIFSDGDELIPPSDLPEDGVCILFIPRTKDISFPGKDPIAADLTDLPITKARWEKISKAFWLLPSHIVKAITRKVTSLTSISHSFISPEDAVPDDKLWMHIAMTSALGPNNFAIASTHVERVHLTLAIMIGCSREQIKRVGELVRGSEDAIRHPLLMLGICAELQLDRLKELVLDTVTMGLETTRRLEATRDDTTGPTAHQHRGEITWDLINQVRTRRDKSKRAEEEVKATKRQLSKALPPALGSLIGRSENNDDNDNKDDSRKNGKARSNSNATNISGSDPKLDPYDEVTNMFTERFADIFAQFEGLIAECRISVEEMSFAADMVGEPFKLSSQHTDVGDEYIDQERVGTTRQ